MSSAHAHCVGTKAALGETRPLHDYAFREAATRRSAQRRWALLSSPRRTSCAPLRSATSARRHPPAILSYAVLYYRIARTNGALCGSRFEVQCSALVARRLAYANYLSGSRTCAATQLTSRTCASGMRPTSVCPPPDVST